MWIYHLKDANGNEMDPVEVKLFGGPKKELSDDEKKQKEENSKKVKKRVAIGAGIGIGALAALFGVAKYADSKKSGGSIEGSDQKLLEDSSDDDGSEDDIDEEDDE